MFGHKSRTPELLFSLLLVLVAAHTLCGETASPAAGLMGKDTCLQCHTGSMKDTVHSRLNAKVPGLSALECESCHGSGETHVANGGGADSIKKPTTDKVKSVCATCHPKDRTEKAGWNRDAHHQNPDLSCLTCHDIHFNKEFSQLKKPQVDLCLTCHKDIGAEFNRAYHHPLAKGQLECSSCHDPHQNDRNNGRKARANATCVKCHSEVRGPFMHEHKAVSDNDGCLNCHNPHGGSTRKLLKQAENTLCLSCHQAQLLVPSYLKDSGTPSRATLEHSRMPALQGQCLKCHTSISGKVGLVGPHNTSGVSCNLCHTSMKGIDHTKYVAEGRCLDCHTDIHGSNHSRAFLD